MDRSQVISRLRAILLQDVASLCRRNDRLWSQPIVRTLREIRDANIEAVVFGGTLRSLLLSRISTGRFGRPRDVDIVVAGTSVDSLREYFRGSIKRETRFGGLQIERMNWQFDVWPLQQTWAFRQRQELRPQFEALPGTTFFNVEAIAVDVWPRRGHGRTVYAGNGQFFEGIADRILEINREDNPFPSLCVVRALVFALSTRFSIGPQLARYLARTGPAVSNDELATVQKHHYGQIRCDPETMRRWLEYIGNRVESQPCEPIALPSPQQLTLWPEDETPVLKLHVLPRMGRR